MIPEAFITFGPWAGFAVTFFALVVIALGVEFGARAVAWGLRRIR